MKGVKDMSERLSGEEDLAIRMVPSERLEDTEAGINDVETLGYDARRKITFNLDLEYDPIAVRGAVETKLPRELGVVLIECSWATLISPLFSPLYNTLHCRA